jgi:hypothetical protein
MNFLTTNTPTVEQYGALVLSYCLSHCLSYPTMGLLLAHRQERVVFAEQSPTITDYNLQHKYPPIHTTSTTPSEKRALEVSNK